MTSEERKIGTGRYTRQRFGWVPGEILFGAALLTVERPKIKSVDHLLDWLLVHSRWLKSRLGHPDGPSADLVAAWERAEWFEVSSLCDAWAEEVAAGSLRSAQTDADRDRVMHDLFFPIRYVKHAALMMSADVDLRRMHHRTMATRMLNEMEIVLGWVFQPYSGYSTEVYELSLTNAVDRITSVFVEAVEYGIDLSAPRAQTEFDEGTRR